MSIQPPESWKRLREHEYPDETDWEGSFVVLFYLFILILSLGI